MRILADISTSGTAITIVLRISSSFGFASGVPRRHDVVAHEAQRLQVLVAVVDQTRRASDDDTAVVHRVVER